MKKEMDAETHNRLINMIMCPPNRFRIAKIRKQEKSVNRKITMVIVSVFGYVMISSMFMDFPTHWPILFWAVSILIFGMLSWSIMILVRICRRLHRLIWEVKEEKEWRKNFIIAVEKERREREEPEDE